MSNPNITTSDLSGELRLAFEAGEVTSAKLKHYLPFSELDRELPTIEPEEEQRQATNNPAEQSH